MRYKQTFEEFYFLKNNDDYLIKKTEHGYLDQQNPYHMEGSVYNHIKMVYDEMSKLTDDETLLKAAILHDIGKYVCRKEDHVKKRVYFRGHPGVSAYMSLNYADDFNKEILFKLAALHSILFKYPNTEVITQSFSKDFWNKLRLLIKADVIGRISSQNSSKNDILGLLKTNVITDPKPKPVDKNKPTLTLLIGPPGAGKSSYIKNTLKDHNSSIISRDDAVMEIAGTDNYTDAFNILSKTNKQRLVDEHIDRKMSKYVKSEASIIIDMTNMTYGSRKRWVSQTKGDYNIKYTMFLTKFNDIMLRNVTRSDKTLPIEALISFMSRFQYPLLYNENYNTIEHVANYNS